MRKLSESDPPAAGLATAHLQASWEAPARPERTVGPRAEVSRALFGIIASLRGRLNDTERSCFAALRCRSISLPSGVMHGTVPIGVLLGLRCTPISAQHRIAALVFQRWISWRSALIRGAKAAH